MSYVLHKTISDGEAPDEDIREVWSTPSLSVTADLLSKELLVPVVLPSVGRIDLFESIACLLKVLEKYLIKNVNTGVQWTQFPTSVA